MQLYYAVVLIFEGFVLTAKVSLQQKHCIGCIETGVELEPGGLQWVAPTGNRM
ncbi:hypothetical protein KC19_4G241600 [Ceratodon purpureus]|uniref:Uncharacterized protein n=1 Tax=Ceratodon purpureus TaxID=3225 RepID=A0A8T0IEK7_CERPU|nr:hypothetical protein KC19_4G241600 [Ceratodon purpureus]